MIRGGERVIEVLLMFFSPARFSFSCHGGGKSGFLY